MTSGSDHGVTYIHVKDAQEKFSNFDADYYRYFIRHFPDIVDLFLDSHSINSY